ncbi:MAG: hypothetical protein LUE98_05395 [Tannerellaceae bacterium]|nr:hypothetical protein [Tannerellaceae bacterium]
MEEGLKWYSGGMKYRKEVHITTTGNQCILDLGEVACTATVYINGKEAGTKLIPPYRFDITDLIRPGENNVEVVVYNTAANHYLSIPTKYRGDTTSGLLGPVKIIIYNN